MEEEVVCVVRVLALEGKRSSALCRGKNLATSRGDIFRKAGKSRVRDISREFVSAV